MYLYFIIIGMFVVVLITLLYFFTEKGNHKNHKNHQSNELNHPCIIPNSKYPILELIFNQKHIIINELKNLLKNNKWSNFDPYAKQNKNRPIFSQMTHSEVITHIKYNENYLNTDNENGGNWRIFGLVLNGCVYNENAIMCPQTTKLLKLCGDKLVNATISCLEPGYETTVHRDYDKSFYRCHIPLIIPKGDCGIKIGNQTVRWNMNEYFIFDDTCYHNAWNNTKSNRFVLLIDIKR
jgi:hypothetical protein